MGSISGLLGGFKKAAGVGTQFFTWNVIAGYVGALTAPFMRATEQDANARDPNAALSPALLADMVLRGHINMDFAIAEAARSGVNADRFTRMVVNTGEPPSPDELANALRRGFIQDGEGPEGSTNYINGIKASRLQDKWSGIVKQLATREPPPVDAVNAYVRGFMQEGESKDEYQKLGGDPQFYDLLKFLAGEGPTPLQVASAVHKGLVQKDGSGFSSTSFEQAVNESSFRNKWKDVIWELSNYRPPPRTITAMYREGSIDEQRATRMLLDYGVRQQDVALYLTKITKTQTQKAHEITEGEILRLYTQQALNRDQVTAILKQHGYSDFDIPYILQAADIQQHTTEINAAITIIKSLYLNGSIDYNTAVTELDSRSILASHRDYLLGLWRLEKAAGSRHLTVANIQKAVEDGLWTTDQGVTRLVAMGYTHDDAVLLIALKLGPESGWAAVEADIQAAAAAPIVQTPPNAIAPSQPGG